MGKIGVFLGGKDQRPFARSYDEPSRADWCRIADHSDPISATHLKMTFIEKWRGYEQCSSRR